MPGSSLWLIPPRNSPVYSIVQTLIDKGIPSLFPSINPPTFPPHVTLTSSIPSSVYTTSSPQAWLDSLQLPTGDEIDVRIIGLDVGNVWNKAITLIVSKGSEEGNDGASHGQMTALMRLAVECRERGVESNASGQVGDKGKVRAKKWVAEDWEPHMSLLYSEIHISESKRAEIEHVTNNAGIEPSMTSFQGGQLWLVPTERDIKEWKPIAIRDL